MHRKRLWYLHPKDSHTNDVLAGELEEHGGFHRLRTNRHVFLPVWECSESKRDFFLASKENANLHFDVYTQLDHDLVIRLAPENEYRKVCHRNTVHMSAEMLDQLQRMTTVVADRKEKVTA
jgi:hypothetical protein